jgi:hypothetical protein
VRGCGDYSPAESCQCDFSCYGYKDCCDDFIDVCDPAATTAAATVFSTSAMGVSTTIFASTADFPVNTTATPSTTTSNSKSTCQAFGCGVYSASHPCQCDPNCPVYKDCCTDHSALCAAG